MLAPLVIRPVGRTLGLLISWRGPAGQLARNNTIRSPRRTAATAAALMVGVAVVALMTMVASSIKTSVDSVVDATMRADFVINSGGQAGATAGFSPSLQQKLATLPQVQTATGVRAGPVRILGSSTIIEAADPSQINDLFDIGVVAGDITKLSPAGIGISSQLANDKQLALWQTIDATFPTTGTKQFVIQAIYRQRDLAGDYVLPLAAAQRNFASQLDYQVYLKLRPGIGMASGRQAIDAVLAGYPTAKLLDRDQYKKTQLTQIDQLLNLVYGLLGLALLIALIGIANTLSLAIHERTRELGLLRAIGMTRGQLRSSIRYESLLVALLGAVEGLVVGVLLGWAIVVAMRSQGVTQLSVPIATLAIIAVLVGLFGVVASVAPGRRAARLDILHAIGTE
jgi:putative ABC transport system permease protein